MGKKPFHGRTASGTRPLTMALVFPGDTMTLIGMAVNTAIIIHG